MFYLIHLNLVNKCPSKLDNLWKKFTYFFIMSSLFLGLIFHFNTLLYFKKCHIKSLLLSHHHSTSALVSEILTSMLQTVQKNKTIYIWTVRIYRLYRRQCAKYTYIYSVHTVYYKDIQTGHNA